MTGTLIKRFSNNGLLPRRDDLFAPFEQVFNKLYDEFFDTGLDSVKGRVGYPKLDVVTDDGKFTVEVAVPGVRAEDVTAEILPYSGDATKRILKISGHMQEDHQYSNKANWHVKELRRSSFERSLLLPDYVQGEPEARLKDGILSLTWECPELKEPERKLIPIKTE